MPAVDTFGIVGTVIAEKYRVDRVVDEGGFSVVYKAEHLIWREPVALKCFKVLAGAPVDQRDQLLDAFIQEGKLMTSLSSRTAAIVQARDIGKLSTREGQWIPYIVMEWLDGRPLDLVLYEEARAQLPARTLSETIALLDTAANAFEICHSRGIVHRDIKPGNLVVIGDARGDSPFVKVLDFGIAKVMAEHAAQQTSSVATRAEISAFTPNYGAPEQFSRSHGATGPWTDVFAMALILTEILRGGKPALEGSDFLQFGMAARDPMRRPSPRTLGVMVSDAVEGVFLQALAVDPNNRFKTMGQFWSALLQAAGENRSWTAPGAPSGRMSTPGIQPSVPLPRSSSPSYPGAFSQGGAAVQPITGQVSGAYPTPSHPSNMGAVYGAPTPYPTPPQIHGVPTPQQVPTSPSNSYQPSMPGHPQTGGNSAPYLGSYMVPASPQTGLPKSRSSLGVGVLAVALMAGAGFGAFLLLGKGKTVASGDTPNSPDVTASTPNPQPPQLPSGAPAAPPTSCPDGMVFVPGGKFYMGSDEATFKLWQPAHKVTLNPYCIDAYEVTVEAYKACSDKGECKRPQPVPDYPKLDSVTEADHEKTKNALTEMCNFGKPGREKHPINCVTWPMADEYCRVSQKRLPTEAEWELAARSRDGRKFPWGDDPVREGHMNACGKECNAWEKAHGLKLTPAMYDVDDGFAGTAPVGSFPAGKTEYGAFDFVGNVWEWTADWFEEYKPDEVTNPKGAAEGTKKAIRGGGWNGGVPLWLNPAFRYHQVPSASAPGIGFRCAKGL
ncbi:MAG: SUMF1/EgtB/PvdO family nonheme iron enzyme [Polyangiaceae bacterium]|nr:SUMF1/EgtB/PvdO family nonheme iron enzyme [Polyangiaceae bacterium]